MKRITLIALAVSSMMAASAFAQTEAELPKTRAEVKADTREAIKDGFVQANDESKLMERDVAPLQYPPAPAFESASRAEIKMERDIARAEGNIRIMRDESKELLKDKYPEKYSSWEGMSKSRAEVKAELQEALRTGDIVMTADTSNQKLNEMYPMQYPHMAE